MARINHNSKRQRRIRKQNQKARNPLKYFFNAFKQNAKRKGRKFELTFDDYAKIWTGKNAKKWAENMRRAEKGLPKKWVIDRVNPKLGYKKSNVQIISLRANASKGATYDKDIHNGVKPERAADEFQDDF